ncbi:unnamed protein product [Protopolystoma xenopodis]|uniref:Uncharacterized protein n=1 Tax=Protopolystoma xenopodis TaxID=117903 RepID=A0A448WFV3_9PLAT|nr:unnamed protein product [Protopolystoma xenopodis]
MGDLQNFIRQQFVDHNWTKDLTISSLSLEKLESIASSFCHIDVKSKLYILLAYSNSDLPSDLQARKHCENVFLQALDEENNLVKAVATILYSKQTLGHLNFDVSSTHESFESNINKLLSTKDLWDESDSPLLAEYLGINASQSSGTLPTQNPCSITGEKHLGFTLRCKPKSIYLKEAYLEKLQDECHRRRVHVPIPSRSHSRQDDLDDTNGSSIGAPGNHSSKHSILEGSGFRRAPVFPRSYNQRNLSSLPENADALTHSGLNSQQIRNSAATIRASLAGKSRHIDDGLEDGSIPLSERLSSLSSASHLRSKTQGGIKLLEFSDLPVHGIKAKQLRKDLF